MGVGDICRLAVVAPLSPLLPEMGKDEAKRRVGNQNGISVTPDDITDSLTRAFMKMITFQ